MQPNKVTVRNKSCTQSLYILAMITQWQNLLTTFSSLQSNLHWKTSSNLVWVSVWKTSRLRNMFTGNIELLKFEQLAEHLFRFKFPLYLFLCFYDCWGVDLVWKTIRFVVATRSSEWRLLQIFHAELVTWVFGVKTKKLALKWQVLSARDAPFIPKHRGDV